MKHQYYGDINDYRKYGLLRTLAQEARFAVCWMLTPDDGGTDGRFTDYLSSPDRWRGYDPQLYDALRSQFIDRRCPRHVSLAEEQDVLGGARFHRDILPDDANGRDAFFDRLWAQAEGCDLIFFDQDNGMEVASVRRGARRSQKYLYRSELAECARRGFSAVVYQHFPREERTAYVARMTARIRECSGIDRVIAFTTARVAFFLAVQPAHGPALLDAAARVESRWPRQILRQKP